MAQSNLIVTTPIKIKVNFSEISDRKLQQVVRIIVEEIDGGFDKLNKKIDLISSAQSQMNVELHKLDEITNGISDEINELVEAKENTVSQRSLNKLKNIADKLKKMGKNSDNLLGSQ